MHFDPMTTTVIDEAPSINLAYAGLCVFQPPAMRRISLASICLLPFAAALSWTTTPFNPSSIPLAVRTPYLSTWLPQGAGAALNDAWPTFWAGQITGWAGFVKVDGVAYSFLGASSVPSATFNKAVQKSFKFTSTQSIFVLSAGAVDLTVTFLSPVEPTDLLKQSIPFSYLSVSAASTDGKAHTVQVYSDISAEWVSGDNSLAVKWNSTTTGSILTHQVQLQTQNVFSEVNDHTQYGSAFYSTPNTVSATYQTGADVTVRAQFINNGKLGNTLDTNFRAINNNWPVFGLAHDLGSVTTASAPVLFSVGHIRDPAIQYIVTGGALQSRSSYFLSQFSTSDAVISSFLGDYSAALGRANTFDAKVQSDASKISADYAGVVAISIRQSLSANEITLSKTSSGAFNTSDVIVFMKEISSDGNVNTVDVIFPAWPIFLYTNPQLGKFLLEGLFRYQASGQYPNKWSVHDLGSSYPKALGHNDGGDEAMPVEESGNMVIMALSYAQKTGDLSHLQRYSALLDQWTSFLISDSLIPANQISTASSYLGVLWVCILICTSRMILPVPWRIKPILRSKASGVGPTMRFFNRAVGIVGIGAMGQIWNLLGNTSKGANYTAIAKSYVTQWQTLSASSTGAHLTLAYGNANSWGLSYNLYGDKLLKLNLFPASVYSQQTAWYSSHANKFGVPLDTRHTYTKTDWEIFTASWATTTAVRDLLISAVKSWVSDGQYNAPFGDLYDTVTGAVAIGFKARPVVGGHLALLTL
ncbi:DUF1793-domain-containing protein [Mycena indigotica]|uniref:DUF1793-domain-containing protein n=1 Tax=Mycena indigotica TaxID=2126181 RepID=A0A8H6SNB5_9AGAR|nr:DUF1793-domain-containing protein [Mycena indigotica]KAF7301796.1 DUF1793-domain-containing protein [Mycena indigotica]